MNVQAAAISVKGVNLVVVLVGMDLMGRPGEADMAIDTLTHSFGDVPVVLMAQKEDGTPRYYGDADIVRSLADVPVDGMPWMEYNT